MKAIQHDIQSLRHAAILRYLAARERIDQRHRRRALGTFVLVLATATVLSVVLLIRSYAQ